MRQCSVDEMRSASVRRELEASRRPRGSTPGVRGTLALRLLGTRRSTLLGFSAAGIRGLGARPYLMRMMVRRGTTTDGSAVVLFMLKRNAKPGAPGPCSARA
jgi:hypothetical protein